MDKSKATKKNVSPRGTKKGSNKSKDCKRNSDSTVDSIAGGYKDIPKNDPAWYNKFPELTQVATQLSWNVALGAPITIDPDYPNGTRLASGTPEKEAGIYSIGFIPTFGVGDMLGDPVNKCALELYAQLRFNKSGNPGYDPVDITQMLLCVDSLYMFIGHLCRVYGILNTVTPTNRYVPRAYVIANGCDFDDLMRNKAQLHYLINSLIVQAAKFNVPKDMSIFDRHQFLVTNIFKDEPIDRSAAFCFVPELLWQYDEVNAKVISVDFWKNHQGGNYGTLWTYSTLEALGWQLLGAIERVDDFYTMNANILSAYDYDGLMKVHGIDPLYMTLPIYREEMLMQIHNMTLLGENWDASKMEVDQNKTQGDVNLGAYIFKPEFTVNSPVSGFEQLLDVPFDHPSIDDILEASRLKVSTELSDATDPSEFVAKVKTCGSEICTIVRIYTFHLNSSNVWGLYTQASAMYGDLTDSFWVKYMSKLNMAPQFARCETVGGQLKPTYWVGDLTNYAVVEQDNLRNMHEAALFAQLAVSRSNLK